MNDSYTSFQIKIENNHKRNLTFSGLIKGPNVRTPNRLINKESCQTRNHGELTFVAQSGLDPLLILIIAHLMFNDSLCCSYKYNWCLCRFKGKLYILRLTFIIKKRFFIILHELFGIKFKPDLIIMKFSPGSYGVKISI